MYAYAKKDGEHYPIFIAYNISVFDGKMTCEGFLCSQTIKEDIELTLSNDSDPITIQTSTPETSIPSAGRYLNAEFMLV